MKFKRKLYLSMLCGVTTGFLVVSGCGFMRKVDTDKIKFDDMVHIDAPEVIENPVQIVVKDGSLLDKDAIFEYFCGKTTEDLSDDEDFLVSTIRGQNATI